MAAIPRTDRQKPVRYEHSGLAFGQRVVSGACLRHRTYELRFRPVCVVVPWFLSLSGELIESNSPRPGFLPCGRQFAVGPFLISVFLNTSFSDYASTISCIHSQKLWASHFWLKSFIGRTGHYFATLRVSGAEFWKGGARMNGGKTFYCPQRHPQAPVHKQPLAARAARVTTASRSAFRSGIRGWLTW